MQVLYEKLLKGKIRGCEWIFFRKNQTRRSGNMVQDLSRVASSLNLLPWFPFQFVELLLIDSFGCLNKLHLFGALLRYTACAFSVYVTGFYGIHLCFQCPWHELLGIQVDSAEDKLAFSSAFGQVSITKHETLKT